MGLCLETLPPDWESKVVYEVKERPDAPYHFFSNSTQPSFVATGFK